MPSDPVILVTLVGVVRLVCQTAAWLMVLREERARACVLATALRVCGPGSVLVDRRAGDATFAVRISRRPAADRGPSGVWGE